MRPIRLSMKGFTAFRDEQTIDFDGLDLFAISGPTGSGKTSILDAMTYALFGKIERVGNQASQFVSQGQVRMAVSFEFAVNGERYRVTRSSPAKGAAAILLQRWHGDWRQAGEGADRVRDANALIERAVGLDYDAFTRTVVLPQGRFAEFLVGDAKERRAILTDLLGLELFERLGKRAGECKREADAQAKAKTALLVTEYAGVTPDAVAEAERAANDAAVRDEALAAAETNVRAVAERWADSARSIRELRACAHDVREAGSVAARTAEALEDLDARMRAGAALVIERTRMVAATGRAHAKAEASRVKAEAAWGRTIDLARLRAKAESLSNLLETRAELQAELEAAQHALPRLRKAAAEALERLRASAGAAEAAMEALEAAEAVMEEARHADLVVAVRAGVHPGEDCPVCGAKVTTLPRSAGARSLDRANARLEKARSKTTAAQAERERSQRAADAASAEVASAEREAARCEKALAKVTKDADAIAAAVAEGFKGKLPADPVGAVDERAERLEGLEEEERVAQVALGDAREALTLAERERDLLAAEVAEARGGFDAIPANGLMDRARSLGAAAPAVSGPGGAKDARALAVSAAALVAAFETTVASLHELAAEREVDEERVVHQAAALVDGLIELRGSTLAELVDEVSTARTSAAKAAATAEDRAEQLRTKLANAAAITEQVGEHRVRAEVFDALAKELRQDRLIAFLQAEALELLAAAGSERLSTLSSGRYRLEFASDEFFVVDTWNGEERRSARTLSGGETFLASLSLALALSEQVRALAVTEKARLDSLFLDEGFGTLDAETLEVVVEAIEHLGGDGRVVGVITHVHELAIRMPARIEVEKSVRGSRLSVVA